MASAATTPDETSFKSIFQSKYEEFCADILLTFPELETTVNAAKALSPEERLTRFKSEVLPHAAPNRDAKLCPAFVLPGVQLTPALWTEISQDTQSIIQEYLTLLAVCCLFDSGDATKENIFGGAAMDDFLKSMKTKMNEGDFENLAKKMAGLFGMDGSRMPKLPEKFLKGHLARLAEEIMRDFSPTDLGLDEETIKKCESDPMNAFEMLMKMYTTNPNFIANAVQKIGKRLQAKIQSGSIRPTEIVAEAEELMKTFSENPAFSDLMETFRGMFGMDDLMKAPGPVGVSARRSIAQERLRKELERRKAAAAAAAMGGGAGSQGTVSPNPFGGPGSGSKKDAGKGGKKRK